MFDAFIQGLLAYGDVVAFSALLIGTAIGIFVGIVPAIGGMAAMALILPLTFNMDSIIALSIIVAIGAIAGTGDSVSTILLGIPGGGAPSAATLFDGFPMTQKGQAGQALGAMLGSASMGSIVGVLMAVGMIPLIRPLVLTFGSPEMFATIIMGISFLTVLSRGSPVKGMIAGFFGIFIAIIGYQHSTGVDRFAFDNTYLLRGLHIVPVAMGLFAGAEMLDLAISGQSIAPAELVRVGKQLRHDIREGMKAVFHNLSLWFRSVVLGYIIGVIPGLGSSVATFVAYGQAKQTCKNPETFGTGRIEGVIAPESCSNAKEGGALLTTLALGIPGSATMALLLAAIMMQGLTPGPTLMRDNLSLVFTLFWGLAIANIIGGVFVYFIMGYVSLTKIIGLSPRYLVPIILTLAYFAAFTTRQLMGDVIITLIFTFVGLLMKNFGFSRPTLLLGFVLGGYLEDYFWLSLKTQGSLFFLSPVVLIIFAITASLYIVGPLKTLVSRGLNSRRIGTISK